MEIGTKYESAPESGGGASAQRLYLVTTVALSFGSISMGCSNNAYSSTIAYFATKYNTDVETLYYSVTISLITYLVGASLASFMYKFINRQLATALLMMVMGVGLALSTHCPTLLVLFTLNAVMSVCTGAYDTSQTVWIIEMWQGKCGPHIQAQFLFIAVGAVVPGFLMAPFLQTTEQQGIDVMWIPYLVLGVLAALTATFQFLLYIFKPYFPPPPKPIEMKEVTSDINGSSNTQSLWPKYLRIKFVTLSAVFLAFSLGGELSAMQFISTFAQFGVHEFSWAMGSLLYSALTGSYIVGALIGIFALLKVPAQYLVIFCFFILLLGNSFLVISNSAVWMLWFGSCLLGLGYSALRPCFIAFIERHVQITNAIGSLFISCCAGTGAIYPIIIGPQIEENPLFLTYANYFTFSVIAVAFVFVWRTSATKRLGKL